MAKPPWAGNGKPDWAGQMYGPGKSEDEDKGRDGVKVTGYYEVLTDRIGFEVGDVVELELDPETEVALFTAGHVVPAEAPAEDDSPSDGEPGEV